MRPMLEGESRESALRCVWCLVAGWVEATATLETSFSAPQPRIWIMLSELGLPAKPCSGDAKVSTPQEVSPELGVPARGRWGRAAGRVPALGIGITRGQAAPPVAGRHLRASRAPSRVRRRSLGRRTYRCVIFDAAFEVESGLVSAMAASSSDEFWFMAWNSLGTSR